MAFEADVMLRALEPGGHLQTEMGGVIKAGVWGLEHQGWDEASETVLDKPEVRLDVTDRWLQAARSRPRIWPPRDRSLHRREDDVGWVRLA